MNVYLTIHCHFYQPPRENPWIDEIERQDTAEPFHDWNERIDSECFTPNGWARIKDGHGRIIDIVNNFQYISFNIGPTLMSWLEEKSPLLYERILEADRKSAAEHNGHGNAIAQVYNHMILPLANTRDKITQVRWGIADFKYRFGRDPESIWLAETAVDYPTLEVLIDHGIKYLILSPMQAQRCRPLGGKEWIDVSNGQIDPTRAYRCFLPDGSLRYIDIFFYDGPISRAVGFEDLLHDSRKLVSRLQSAISPDRQHVQLISAATDGETYGHHKPYGEMALAYAAVKEAPARGFKLTNYGEFLEMNPPQWEVEIKSVSAWSCAHGVGRWLDDCGCKDEMSMHQRWRRPLREALDWLRDELIVLYEREAPQFLNDPWEARNDYISVILKRTDESLKEFFARHGRADLDGDERNRAVLLLEMQRHAMLMYTSCAWFFSELSRIETVQVLRYAARAIQLAEEFSDYNYEDNFILRLEAAPSNIPSFGNGAAIYRQLVKPSVVRLERVAHFYAVKALFEELPKQSRIFSFDAQQLDLHIERAGLLSLAVGRVKLKSIITSEVRDFVFGLLHTGGRDIYCAVRPYPGNAHYKHIKTEIFRRFDEQSLMEIIRGIDEHFGPYNFTFKDLLIEMRRDLLKRVSDEMLQRFAQTYERIYEDNQRVIRALKADGLPVPTEYRIAAEYTLSWRLNKQIEQLVDVFDPESYKEIQSIIAETEEYGFKLNTPLASRTLGPALNEKLETMAKLPAEQLTVEIFQQVAHFLELAARLRIHVPIRRAQDIYFQFLTERFSDIAGKEPASWHAAAIELGKWLSLNTDRFQQQAKLTAAAD